MLDSTRRRYGSPKTCHDGRCQTMQLVQLLHVLQRRRRRRRTAQRAVWVRPWIARRPDLGIYNRLLVELRNEDPRAFHNFMRMPPDMFDELVNRLTPRLTRPSTNCRPNLEPGLKVALTLRHLASGTTYMDMQYAWRVPHNTLSKVVREVCEAIVGEYLDELMTCPTTDAGWRHIADGWLQRWNFPHTIGAIDGKHVACKAPPNTASQYYNYKGYFSIILLALVSSDYMFLWEDESGCGAASDAQIYNSELRHGLEHGDITGWPHPDPLPNDTQDVPYLVGDDAFSLRTYLMKPYSSRNLSREECIFNYRLSRARRVVENAFGILANRFQVLLTTMQHHVDTVRLIVRACVLLHNLMQTRYPVLQNTLLDQQLQDGQMVPGEWRRGQILDDTVDVQAPNRASKAAKLQQNLIKH
ncbi:putative nuclease HARBI1 [Thalassophryne amazonica]|uniref:putative nuclease HARBI1 n=1 Tax=Thalassophryne amazonica TaxID=390379 RepID=UPI001471BFF4|nr:putative nuclease HARBI1 [Thalassophryne amazonica]